MDVWIDFKHASKWQAEYDPPYFPSLIPKTLTNQRLLRGIFLNFFPCRQAADPQAKAQEEGNSADPLSRPVMPPRKRTRMHAVPLLEEAALQALAKEFAAAIPENELSVSRRSMLSRVRWLNVSSSNRWQACRVTS